MSYLQARFETAEDAVSNNQSAMAELFLPLDKLLRGGGDPRLALNPMTGANQYGCQPVPCPSTLSFASSTATSISSRAYDRAEIARASLMRSAIAIGIEAAFDDRIEAMRGELKTHLDIDAAGTEIVFSPSGTDSQLQALFLTRALLGSALTTIIVAADQTGSGTMETARGRHFGEATASGSHVRKGDPIEGLAHFVDSVAIGLLDAAGELRSPAENDERVLSAIEKSIARGANVLLQVMDASKLGVRAPTDRCLTEIARRWPKQVQVVVDACQMRSGRARLKKYLDSGYLVIVTGSKFFTGPAFSGALLVPSVFSSAFDTNLAMARGLRDYSSRSDWPQKWHALRSQFPVRLNFGQWLRWEAALEEIRAYYQVPADFRLNALKVFGQGVRSMIVSSPSLRLLSLPAVGQENIADDEELSQQTIFPFVIKHNGRMLSLDDCKTLYRALARNASDAVLATERMCDAGIAAKRCLIGQPVALGRDKAVLRICAGARLVTETWSADENIAHANMQQELARVGAIVAKIKWLLTHMDSVKLREIRHGI